MRTKLFKRLRTGMRVFATVAILAVAALVVAVIWDHYTVVPWTRDGQVRVQVANIAPQISGQIVELRVRDNQFVRKGDVLYVIDPFDYKVALASAQATVQEKQADLAVKTAQDKRRQQLTDLSTSIEEKQTYQGSAQQAAAAYAASLATLSQARINLQRTEVRSTVNGYVTNLLLRVGDYASTGSQNVQVIDADSYWVDGYFEETKLAAIHIGDPATITLMGYKDALTGHVRSIVRGISTSNAAPSTQGLPSVDPVYTWVRLAQRIPVRVQIDRVPPDVVLAAGMTATVTVHSAHAPPRLPGALPERIERRIERPLLLSRADAAALAR